ncbi:hypothetical protein [Diaminobutyricibacter sp. McL0608]|uniref:hypothetical protein n=1 Tax=Leifsonia sp. McL0608 TaxID=3143537 RepID=UPI0031F2F10E
MQPSTFILFLTGAVLLSAGAAAAFIHGYRFRTLPDPRLGDDGAERDITGELNEQLFTPPLLTCSSAPTGEPALDLVLRTAASCSTSNEASSLVPPDLRPFVLAEPIGSATTLKLPRPGEHQ